MFAVGDGAPAQAPTSRFSIKFATDNSLCPFFGAAGAKKGPKKRRGNVSLSAESDLRRRLKNPQGF